MNTRLLSLVALVLGTPCMAGPAEQPAWGDKLEKGNAAVVEVNGTRITLQELYEVVMRRHARQTLSEMVQRLLVEQEAKKAGVDVTADEIEARLRTVRESVVAEARREAVDRKEDPAKVDGNRVFASWLARNYLGASEFRRHLRTTLLAEKIVRQSVTVKDADLHTFRARVISVTLKKHTAADAKKLCDGIQKEAAEGADFAVLARKRSEDEFAAAGGLLPEFRAGDIYLPVEPVAAGALLKLKPGEVTPTIKGEYGYYVLKLESSRPPGEMDAISREELRERLVSERVQAALNPWLQQLRARAKIEIKDKRFE